MCDVDSSGSSGGGGVEEGSGPPRFTGQSEARGKEGEGDGEREGGGTERKRVSWCMGGREGGRDGGRWKEWRVRACVRASVFVQESLRPLLPNPLRAQVSLRENSFG